MQILIICCIIMSSDNVCDLAICEYSSRAQPKLLSNIVKMIKKSCQQLVESSQYFIRDYPNGDIGDRESYPTCLKELGNELSDES